MKDFPSSFFEYVTCPRIAKDYLCSSDYHYPLRQFLFTYLIQNKCTYFLSVLASSEQFATIFNLSFILRFRQSTLFDFKSEHIAEQMTLLDAELFNNIEIPEVLIWTQEQDEKTSPNLTRFTEHFNKVSFWSVNQRNFPTFFCVLQFVYFGCKMLNVYVSWFQGAVANSRTN